MADIDEHDIRHKHQGDSMGFVMGIILLVVTLFLFLYYLLPAVRGSSMQLQIPGRIDVNVHQLK